MLQSQGQVLARREALQAQDIHLIGGLNFFVILSVSKGQRQHSLLLQVCLVNSGKRPHDDGEATKESGLKGGVFTRRAFTVVVIANDNPFDALLAIVSSSLRDTVPSTRKLVLDLVGLTVLRVDGTNQAIF